MLHVRNMRFGGEAGGITAVVNYAPFACQEVSSQLETEMCGRVNRSGPVPNSGMRGAGGSSVIIDGKKMGLDKTMKVHASFILGGRDALMSILCVHILLQ